MKVAMVTVMTPWKENYKGTSALPYHLLVHRPDNVDVEIWSFNNNDLPENRIRQVEGELGVKIHLLGKPWWWKILFRLHLLFIRVFLSLPIHSYLRLNEKDAKAVRDWRPDKVWVYGEELVHVDMQLADFPRIHTLPDSEALYYYRMLDRSFVADHWRVYLRNVLMYPKFRRLERLFPQNNIWYHLVGAADATFLREENPGIDVRFLRHPHYEVGSQEPRHFHSPIRLLIAGQYNYYMKEMADSLIPVLVKASDLVDKYELTFLGKGWEQHAATLKASGWNVKIVTFAPDYVAEVRRHDIQLTPIVIGTGTKGKVLDAIANGLLEIGTPYALENIAVENGKSCLCFHTPDEAISILRVIPNDILHFEQMAIAGQKRVLELHSRHIIAQQLFS